MPSLDESAAIAEVVGAIVVIGGVGFALLQVSAFRRQREDIAAASFFQTIFNPDAIAELDRVYALPDDASASAIVAAGPEAVRAADRVYIMGEWLGFLAYRGAIPMATIDQMAGGFVRVGWRKLRRWVQHKRDVSGSPTPGEWFQWLNDHLTARGEGALREPAYVAHPPRRRR